VGADIIGWLHGLDHLPYALFDQPDFPARLLDMIATWNRSRMEVVLQAGVHLYVKRAWYENTSFFISRHYPQFIQPILAADVVLAELYGAKLGYIITADCMPLLDDIQQAGLDAIFGVAPAAWNLDSAKARLGGRVCLWGGVNGHLTVEQGSAERVRAEVRRAMGILAPNGGSILSPLDDVRQDMPQPGPTWRR